ncbi:MAG: hypothetical protein VB096_04785 [Pseudoflavonifractor sp.]|nr:hypothetical protein [Pseudoflavonifractor sp.]
MKKTLKNALDHAARKFCAAVTVKKSAVREKLAENSGQFVMDHAVVFVLIIVLGGIALALLTNFLQSDMAPTLKSKIMEFFK